MQIRPRHLRIVGDAAQRVGVDVAIERLQAGELIVMPTETIYGVFARADLAPAVERLREAIEPAANGAFGDRLGAWHAPDAKDVFEALRPTRRAHRRALRRLLPASATLLVPSGEGARGIRTRLKVETGVVDSAGEFGVRVPSDEVCTSVLRGAGGAVVGVGLSRLRGRESAEPGARGGLTLSAREIRGEAIARCEALGISLLLDAGPTRARVPSSLVRLHEDGRVEMLHEGALDARTMARRLRRTILFVCTGNTCRSPMAGAIARAIVSREEERIETEVLSAGLSAGAGEPATPEAIEALREMDPSLADDLEGHRARGLSAELVRGADVIYAMTESHRRGVLALDPFAPVIVLDEGGDIPDPIGGPLEEYRRTARTMARTIEKRLKELDP